jgi:hypothetical protein
MVHLPCTSSTTPPLMKNLHQPFSVDAFPTLQSWWRAFCGRSTLPALGNNSPTQCRWRVPSLEERARSNSNFALVYIHILEQYKLTAPFLLGKILVDNFISCCFICRPSASFFYQQAMLAFYAVVRYLDAFTRDLGLRYWASGR